MEEIILQLLGMMNQKKLVDAGIIPWACPVPFFGSIENSRVATLGLNPSNLEFMDSTGNELSVHAKRLPTLSSFGLENWQASGSGSEISQKIYEGCLGYFKNRPYDFWFKKLDYLIDGADVSYYFPKNNACHLDIVPFATYDKWNALSQSTKAQMTASVGSFLGRILNKSEIHTLILNGKSVIAELERISGVTLEYLNKPDWSTSRRDSDPIMGKAFFGEISRIGDVGLNNKIRVLGYNHNIQSSFGITRNIQLKIRSWIKEQLG